MSNADAVCVDARTNPQPGSAWTTFVACLGAFLDGYDLVIISGALLFIRAELKLTPAEVGWVGSVVFVGMIIGALGFGRLTDRIGRNTSFIFVLLLFVVGSLVSALATSGPVLVIGRLIVGLGIGADLPVSSTLIAECVPASRRGLATGLMQVFWFGGAAFSGLVSVLFYLAWGANSWRWMLGSAVILAIVVIILRRSITESRRWEEARRSHATAAREAPQQAAAVPAQGGVLRLWGNRSLRIPLLFSCLFWFAMTVRGAGFNLYTPTLLQQIGLTGYLESLTLGCVTNFIYTAAILVAVLFLDRFRRRDFVLWCWLATTVLTCALLTVTSGNVVWLFLMITLSLLPIQILAAAMFPLSVEPFPTLCRATAQGLSSAAGKFGGFLAALMFPILLGSVGFFGLTVSLIGFMVVVMVAGWLVRFPDTTGRELEEIEASDA